MKMIKLPRGIFEYDPAAPLGRRGGFGQVFAGRTADGIDVAIKKLHVTAADAAHRELRVAEELKSRSFQHVIPFIDAGEDADTGDYFVVMTKAEMSLQSALDSGNVFTATDTTAVLLQITKGLLEVGELVHRDLKPDNILLHEGKWQVADFGIARFVEEATASNTLKDCLSPYYAAPEQWRFERATHATDVYALGCIGFCLLTGKPPFTANPEMQHQKEAVPVFSCSDSRLQALLNMMTRKQPETRPGLSRIKDLFADIVSKPQQTGTSDALAVLASAGAQVAVKEQRLQAERYSKEQVRKERMQLAASAFGILVENARRLWVKVQAQAPNAQLVTGRSGNSFECQLGYGRLTMTPLKADCIEAGVFKESGWDIVAASKILVTRQNPPHPPYVWSASLWYARVKGSSEYRWYEVSYWSWEGQEFVPFACSDFRDADYAASNIMHTVNIAFGPAAIDDEKEDDFHSRWMWLFAQASIGTLRRPSALPIVGWPPQI